ncbi:hypothetical protein LWI28_001457 [Acer negundo]|uniref:Carbonic anhydrase n=1 Tax=Acer negundo TaxID=4023 RepID=A0AAD5NE43_ACENE|nr:hypothetical protein LWI28_001457 [Acer negundo]KAK4834488.1 hypothetical protein QYF36_023698 [Acer negundo]
MISKIPLFIISISLFLGLALAVIDNDIELDSVDFSYSGATGPSNWGTLKPEYALCSSGLQQSPVNIIQEYTILNQNLKLSKQYDAVANATLINLVFQIELKYDGDIGGLEINGKTYNFEEMHWHSPSEHLIDGQRFAAELHLVHRAEDRSAAVNAILYEFGNSPMDVDPFLAELGDALEILSENNVTQVDVGMLNTEPLTQNYRKFYRYDGSFTTPPCQEGVIWTILGEVKTISQEQVVALKAPLPPENKDNARPEQPLNCREIELYDELI